jgi:hypothetical protein
MKTNNTKDKEKVTSAHIGNNLALQYNYHLIANNIVPPRNLKI